jgi:hypothetical protein
MHQLGSKICLVDGFPRDIDNWTAWREQTQVVPHMTMILSAPEEVLRERLIHRKIDSGRVDDDEAVIKKRLKVHSSSENACWFAHHHGKSQSPSFTSQIPLNTTRINKRKLLFLDAQQFAASERTVAMFPPWISPCLRVGRCTCCWIHQPFCPSWTNDMSFACTHGLSHLMLLACATSRRNDAVRGQTRSNLAQHAIRS